MRLLTLAAVLLVALGCSEAPPPPRHVVPPPRPATERQVPDGPLGASITRGLALLEHTADSLPAYVGGNLRCTSCHLERGLREGAAPLTGVHDRYPRFVERTGAVVLIEDRVNYCFTRSLSGRALPPRSREMVDIVAYMAFISHGTFGKVEPALASVAADSVRGGEVYAANCARCHGVDGAGMQTTPAVWGPRSYSVGASMARVGRVAAFIRRNMPFDKPGTLTDQQAYDVAAYIDGHARPDLPGKALDWPAGNAPADVPYATRGHTPMRVTQVLPRPRVDDASVVPAPTSVVGAQRRD